MANDQSSILFPRLRVRSSDYRFHVCCLVRFFKEKKNKEITIIINEKKNEKGEIKMKGNYVGTFIGQRINRERSVEYLKFIQ